MGFSKLGNNSMQSKTETFDTYYVYNKYILWRFLSVNAGSFWTF